MKAMTLLVSAACFNFYHICISWQSNPNGLKQMYFHHRVSPEPIYPESLDKDKTPSCHAPGQLCNADQRTAANNKGIVFM